MEGLTDSRLLWMMLLMMKWFKGRLRLPLVCSCLSVRILVSFMLPFLRFSRWVCACHVLALVSFLFVLRSVSSLLCVWRGIRGAGVVLVRLVVSSYFCSMLCCGALASVGRWRSVICLYD